MYALKTHFIPHDNVVEKIAAFSEDKGISLGAAFALLGFVISIAAFLIWQQSGFSQMNPERLMRYVLPATTLIEVGIETIFACFFIGVLKIKSRT